MSLGRVYIKINNIRCIYSLEYLASRASNMKKNQNNKLTEKGKICHECLRGLKKSLSAPSQILILQPI